MARRRRHEEDHVNHERWLVSYADFITLLFAFFVVMYAISSVNEGKYRVLSDALDQAFRAEQSGGDPIALGDSSGVIAPDMGMSAAAARQSIVPATTITELEEASLDTPPVTGPAPGDGGLQDKRESTGRIGDAVEVQLAPLVDRNLIEVRRKDNWIEIELRSNVLFASGSARLENDAAPLLGQIATVLRSFGNPVQVEGYTDNAPIATSVFPSNWELSGGRAAAVVQSLARLGIRPERMSAVGYGEFRPVADNETADGRQRNRRVVIVVPGGDWRNASAAGDGAAPVQLPPQPDTVPAAGPVFQRVLELPEREQPIP